MARFDVHRLSDGGLVLDCQADFLDEIATRFVVPLAPLGEGPPTNTRLNPRLEVNGETLVMLTQFATSIRTAELRAKVASLDHAHFQIIGAIDVLTGSG